MISRKKIICLWLSSNQMPHQVLQSWHLMFTKVAKLTLTLWRHVSVRVTRWTKFLGVLVMSMAFFITFCWKSSEFHMFLCNFELYQNQRFSRVYSTYDRHEMRFLPSWNHFHSIQNNLRTSFPTTSLKLKA